MSTRYSTPLVSDTERGLIERSKRMNAPVPPLLVKLQQAPEIALQLPDEESALATISRKLAAPVADFSVVPALILNEQDLEDSGLFSEKAVVRTASIPTSIVKVRINQQNPVQIEVQKS